MSDRLATGGTVTLDGTGAGSLVVGPARQAERWNVARYSTAGSSAVEPSLTVARGSALIDSTPHGNADTSEVASELVLWGGESLRFTYTGGSPGARMTVYVEGDVDYGVVS